MVCERRRYRPKLGRHLFEALSSPTHSQQPPRPALTRFQHLPKFVRTPAIRWMNLGEVPGVLPKGLSVHRYTVSVRGSAFWSSKEPTQTEQLVRLKRFGH